VLANYEYGPFGEVIRSTGPIAKANPIRFSTKYQDDESDLLYYGYRYYKASTGSWVSRDPATETGADNQFNFSDNDLTDEDGDSSPYRYVFNAPLAFIDLFGLAAGSGSSAGDDKPPCPCKCKTVAVTTDPKKPGFYNVPDVLGDNPRFGMKITITWTVDGDPSKCQYFVNELPDGLKSTFPDGTKGSTPGTGGYVNVTGWNSQQIPNVYEDNSGLKVGSKGKYKAKYKMHQDYLCISADGTQATGSHDFKTSGSGKWTGSFPKK
jgi:RHS repeat-associated protein